MKIFYSINMLLSILLIACNLPQDASTQQLSSEKAITSFSFERVKQTVNSSSPGISTILAVDVNGSFSGNSISLSVPNTTSLTSLVASFATSGFRVAIGSTHQVSGTTKNDFSTNQTYTVYAEDESAQAYAVSVSTYPPAATAPEAYNVSIAGAPNEFLTLKGIYYYGDINNNAEAGSTYRWLRSATENGTYTATGTITQTYVTSAADVGMYLKFEVTPVTGTAPTTGSAVLSSAFGPIASGIPACNFTINEWADAGSDVDYIEIKNFSPYSLVVSNSATVFQVNYEDGTNFTLGNYLDDNVNTLASAQSSADGVVIAAGEKFLITDQHPGGGMVDDDITTIRGFSGFTGKVFFNSSESTLIGGTDRLHQDQVNLTDGTRTWSTTPTTADFVNVGSSTYSALKPTFNCATDSTTDASHWQNGSTENRSAGQENPLL